ncbi:MAG: BatD family protein, partial [Prolixibacteraceae bacterium]
MGKQFIIYLLLFFSVLGARAEKTRFEMSAPNAVEKGKQFRLSFTLNERGTNLQLPSNLTGNFEVLMGPSTGQSTRMQTINGQTSTEVTYSYTYILRAKETGTFEIRPASIEVDGKVFESNSVEIQVVPPQSQPRQPQSGTQPENESQTVDLDRDNLFVRVEMNKQNVYRGEQIIATVKLYVNPNINLGGFDEVNLPTYE